ncbi:MAG: Lin0512 family protein [Granulosicoccus sp.]|nr:Lin0512 family protein [Granulosicoccus sp.]
MARKRMVVEMGMGTDLQGQDYTKAAVRALRDALWHNSLTVAPAFGVPREKMDVEVTVGVAKPEKVDPQAVADVLPYGTSSVSVVQGGLDIPSADGQKVTVVANAAAVVYLDLEETR